MSIEWDESEPLFKTRKPHWKRILEEEGARELLKKRNGRKKNPNKTYMKRCKRCEKIYKTKCQRSKICDDCKLPQGKGAILKNEVN